MVAERNLEDISPAVPIAAQMRNTGARRGMPNASAISAPAAMSRDELFALQDARFRKLMVRGWEIPFYRRLWGARGIEPGAICGLADIGKLPVCDKSDLMERGPLDAVRT